MDKFLSFFGATPMLWENDFFKSLKIFKLLSDENAMSKLHFKCFYCLSAYLTGMRQLESSSRIVRD